MNFRNGNKNDIDQLKLLGLKSWAQFKDDLTINNWNKLYRTLNSKETYAELLEKSQCVVCENQANEIIGMAFLVPSGNPTQIYDKEWCHLRFVSVDPDFRGKRIGETLTLKCIDIALKNKERMMALHTSEIMQTARYMYTKIGFRNLKEIAPSLGVRYWIYTLDLTGFNG